MGALKVFLVFAIMIVFLVRRVSLTKVLIGGSLILALLCWTPPLHFLEMAFHGIFDKTTLELVLILLLIMVLEHILRIENYLDDMLTGLQAIVPYPRFILMLLPCFIGLMPSAGGARFSAPLVEEASKNMVITPEQKSYVNFFYRHITEYLLPIYPNVILASSITGLTVNGILHYMIPYGLLNILVGLPWVLTIPKPEKKIIPKETKVPMLKRFLSGTWPIIAIVFIVLGMGLRVWAATLMIMALLALRHRYSPRKIIKICQESIQWPTLVMVMAIMLFKAILEGTGVIKDLPELMNMLPVPSFVVFALVFFFLGTITGLQSAAVGLGFPIVMAAFGTISPLMAGSLYACGLCGQMLTPLHLCLTLTTDYFKANLGKVMRMLALPELTLFTLVILSYLYFSA